MAFKMKGFNPGKGTGIGNNFTVNTGSGFTKSNITPFAADVDLYKYKKLLKSYTSKFGKLNPGQYPEYTKTQRYDADGYIEDIPEDKQGNSFRDKFRSGYRTEEEFEQAYKEYKEMHEKVYNQTMQLAANGKLPKNLHKRFMDEATINTANSATKDGYYKEHDEQGGTYVNADGEVVGTYDEDSDTWVGPDGSEFNPTPTPSDNVSDGGGIITVDEEREGELKDLFNMNDSEQESPPQELWIGGENPNDDDDVDGDGVENEEDDDVDVDVDADGEGDGEGDEGSEVSIGGDEEDDANLDVDDKKDEFDPADANQDNYVDKWERKDYEKLQAQQDQDEEEIVEEEEEEEIVEEEEEEPVIEEEEEPVASLEGDYNNDGVVDYRDKRFAPMSKNINHSPMNKFEMSLSAERNPYKYDSDNYWKWRNENSRSHAKKVRSQYRKFL